MIIRHLPFFAVAAEEENLQRAALRLGITQPALSRRIHDLEDEIGLRLFERVSGRLKLTPTGSEFAIEARRIVDEVDELTTKLKRQSGRDVSRLSLGLNERAIALPGVANAIRTFRKDSPGTELTVQIMSSIQQADALRGGEIDLAILYIDAARHTFESRLLLDDDPFLAVLSADHRLTALGTLTIADLADEKLIWPSRERIPLGYEYLKGIWAGQGIKPQVSTEVYSADAALHAVLAGLGVAIIRRSMFYLNIPGIISRSVAELTATPFPLSVAWIERQGSPMRRRFLNLLRGRHLIEEEPTTDAGAEGLDGEDGGAAVISSGASADPAM